MKFTLKIWRQAGPADKGRLVTYQAKDISPAMSFLEMLDVVNHELTLKGEEPVAFEYDCREGICGSCSLVIDGVPHGPDRGITACELYMRRFKDGATITIEPWRAKAFPIIKDLVVDRSALDRIMQAGGYISVNTGGAVDGNVFLIGKDQAETAMDAASCISCAAPAWPPARMRRPRCLSRPRSPTLPCCLKAIRNERSAPRPWSPRWTAKGSGLVETSMNVKPCAQNRSASGSSPS